MKFTTRTLSLLVAAVVTIGALAEASPVELEEIALRQRARSREGQCAFASDGHYSQRPNLASISEDEWDLFVEAMNMLKANDRYDYYVDLHSSLPTHAHGGKFCCAM